MEMGNVSKWQQPNYRANEGHQWVFNVARICLGETKLSLSYRFFNEFLLRSFLKYLWYQAPESNGLGLMST